MNWITNLLPTSWYLNANLKTQVNSILPSKSFIWQTMLSLQQADLSLFKLTCYVCTWSQIARCTHRPGEVVTRHGFPCRFMVQNTVSRWFVFNYQSASSRRNKCVCVCQQNDMPSIGGYIEDTLILRSCHTTGFLQTCWGKKTTVEFMIVPTPCDLCKRCVWECGDSAASLDSTSMVSCVCVMLFVL